MFPRMRVGQWAWLSAFLLLAATLIAGFILITTTVSEGPGGIRNLTCDGRIGPCRIVHVHAYFRTGTAILIAGAIVGLFLLASTLRRGRSQLPALHL